MSTDPTPRRQGTGAVLPRSESVPWIPNCPVSVQEWRTRHEKGKSETPELKLARAIFGMALDDLNRQPSTTDGHRRDYRHDARRWLTLNDWRWPGSFVRLCDLLGYDIQATRDKLEANLEPLPEAAPKPKPPTLGEQVLAVLRRLGPCTPVGIRRVSAINHNSLSAALGALLRRQEIERCEGGRYRIRGADGPVPAQEGAGCVGDAGTTGGSQPAESAADATAARLGGK